LSDVSSARTTEIVLYGVRGRADQFVGVPEALQRRGIGTLYERLWGEEIKWGGHVHSQLIRRASAVVCADLTHNGHVRVVRMARKHNVPSALLVDGVVEWSNVMLNKWLGKRYLRPAPEDVVMCSGPLHAEILGAMGNRTEVTGLPRLTGFGALVEQHRAEREHAREPKQRRVLITTANFPAGNESAKRRILVCLEALRDAMRCASVQPIWRLTGGLCEAIGVPQDSHTLAESLAAADALVTTASTVAIERMLAGVPCGVFHPHPWPLWVPGVWEWKPNVPCADEELQLVRSKIDESSIVCSTADEAIERLRGGSAAAGPRDSLGLEQQAGSFIESLLQPSEEQMCLQSRLRDGMYLGDAPECVAGVLERVARREDGASGGTTGEQIQIESYGPTCIETPSAAVGSAEIKTVVSFVVARDWPAHAVGAWSSRMSRVFEEMPEHGYRFHTVHVVTDPRSYEETGVLQDLKERGHHIITLDPSEDTAARMGRIVDAVGNLKPDIVVPNEGDIAFAACACLRDRGARQLVVLHHDAWSMRRELCTYSGWDALVIGGGAEGDDAKWDGGLCGEVSGRIPYGVPVIGKRSARVNGAPLELAYIGTITQDRRRVFDLIEVLRGLNQRGIRYVFHLVGDGPDLESWIDRARLAGVDDRVAVHGRVSSKSVERLLHRIDICMLVSESEGVGMTMFEAMGAGVVPCVTDTGGGPSRIVRDGVDGMVVPVGACEEMAVRIAGLVAQPGSLESMSCAACACIRAHSLDVRTMARRYAAVFDCVLESERQRTPSDDCVRLSCTENIRHPDCPEESDAWCRDSLTHAGYRAVSTGLSAQGCDAVLVGACDARPTSEQVDGWRESGLGVAISPNMCLDRREQSAEGAVVSLLDRGCQRIAVCAAPGQTNRVARMAFNEKRIVGFVDPLAARGDTHLGLPAAHPEDAGAVLGPDAVLLLGGVAEAVLFELCKPIAGSVVRECVDTSAGDFSACQRGIDELAQDIRDNRRVVLLTDPGASVLLAQQIGVGVEVIEIKDCGAPIDLSHASTEDGVLGIAMLEATEQADMAAMRWIRRGGVVRSFPGKIEMKGDIAR
jgi:glycosyltransferase involved in cell wall biosynthesis